MVSDDDTLYRAVSSRDRRFEGRFVVAVRTTGIYCRPGCPAPIPKRVNVRFYRIAAAAEEAGFRPCARCRPDASPETPAWFGTSSTVRRALRLIEESGTDEGLEPLADRLGVGARHLRRLFAEHVGASPIAVANTRRLHFARKLVDETDLPMSDIAFASGFMSVRRFNDAMRVTFRKPPTELRATRRKGDRAPTVPGAIVLRLPFKAPLDWKRTIAFLAGRATPGVEVATERAYMRTIGLGGDAWGTIHVAPCPGEAELELTVRAPVSELFAIVERVRAIFDLRADPEAIAAHLGRDEQLARAVAARPGLRVPGAWDAFEIAVRAILGQQVSVARATVLAGRLVGAFGRALPPASPEGEPSGDAIVSKLTISAIEGLSHVFPRPEALAEGDIASIGMPGARGAAIRGLAAQVASGALSLDEFAGLEETVVRLTALPGIGPWTAHYIAMRALGEPDAFPATDLVIRRVLSRGARCSIRELEARAEAWRPWRAYAAMHLWTAAAEA